ncbi:MAG: FkbM family methyltransferase [Oscillospiraceae bacterium]|nr:FkbM family methyltransferase [Oscillospiraceae bacterium]
MLSFIKEKTTCWEFLQRASLPIFLYGMGDGAQKILGVFEDYGIAASGVFASDEFVRGQTFAGHLVRTLAGTEQYVADSKNSSLTPQSSNLNPGFIIVLAFASNRRDVCGKINELAKKYTLLAPDVPVAGGGLFTYDYCLKNAEKIERVYNMLADEPSRQVYADVINFKISGKIEYLNNCTSARGEVYSGIFKLSGSEVFADLGAYTGDTAAEFSAAVNGAYKKIYAFEPNPRNFKRLSKNLGEGEKIKLFCGAAWSEGGFLPFTNGEGRMTKVAEAGEKLVPCYALDNAVSENVTLIKLDVEGAERQAISGAKRHIRNGAKIICALYHRNEDMFELPLLLHELNPRLKFYIRRPLYIPAWETNLYCLEL